MVACTLIVVGEAVGDGLVPGVGSVADVGAASVAGAGIDPAEDGAGSDAVGAADASAGTLVPFAGAMVGPVVLGSTGTNPVWVALKVASGWAEAPSLTRPPSRTTMPVSTPRATATASAVRATHVRRATCSPPVTDRLQRVP